MLHKTSNLAAILNIILKGFFKKDNQKMYCLHKNYHFDVPNWHHHKNSNNMFAWLLTLAIINTSQANILSYSSNPFSTNIPLLYPLKRSENLRFSDVFRGYRSGHSLNFTRQSAFSFGIFHSTCQANKTALGPTRNIQYNFGKMDLIKHNHS